MLSQSVEQACARMSTQDDGVKIIEDDIKKWVDCPYDSGAIDALIDEGTTRPFEGSSIRAAKTWIESGRPCPTTDEIVAQIRIAQQRTPSWAYERKDSPNWGDSYSKND